MSAEIVTAIVLATVNARSDVLAMAKSAIEAPSGSKPDE